MHTESAGEAPVAMDEPADVARCMFQGPKRNVLQGEFT